MQRIKCIIVDDELSIIKSLERLIKQIPQLEIIASFTNPVEALSFLRKNDVYLVFLDISMDILSGMDLAKLITNKIIFVTGSEEFALKSWRIENVVDYLVKPVFFQDIVQAVKKATTLFNAEAFGPQMNNDRFLIYKNDDATVKIDYDSINYIEAKGHYSVIHLEDKQIIAPIPLWEMEKTLPQSKFVRVNKSTIANSNKILDPDPKGIILIGGIMLKPGKAYKQNLDATER